MRSFFFFVPFIYLLFLFFSAYKCINAERAKEAEDVDIFVPHKTHVSLVYGNVKDHQKEVEKFSFPALVYVDGVLVAFAETKYTEGYKRSADIVSRNITIDKTKDWKTQVLSENSWKTHIAVTKNKEGDNGHNDMMNPGAVVNDKKIYLIAGSKKTDVATKGRASSRQAGLEDWDIELVVGGVNDVAGNKTVNWKEPKSLKQSIMEELKKIKDHGVITIAGSAGAPIVTRDGAFVFILVGKTGEGETVNVIVQLKENSGRWDKVRVITEKEGKYPAVLEWENSKLLVMTSKDGDNKIYELNGDWTTLTKTGGMLSRVWVNNKKRSVLGYSNSVIKANINNVDVLLFAQPVKTKSSKYQLHLWMTNGYRVYNAGPVSAEQNGDFLSVLLYADDMLFMLYYREDSSTPGYFLRPLAGALKRVKEALGTWDKQNAALSEPCEECGESVAVQGLVGFLSDSGNTTHWADEYLCVNAIVSKAAKVTNGFEFKGAGSGAQWLVNTEKQNHPYHFANYEFTLVATVIIHEVPEDISPVLSLSLDKEMVHKRRLALWYDKDERWHTKYSSDEDLKTESWEPKKAYLVALTLKEEKGHVYVDGEPLGSGVDMSGLNTSLSVSHFSIGRDEENGASYGHMIVTDVFLYNRKLNGDEFKGLVSRKERLAPKLEAPRPTPTPQSPDVHTGGGGGVGGGGGGGGRGGGNGGGSGHTDTNIVSGGTGHDANNTTGGRNENPALEKDVSERFSNTRAFLVLLLLLFVCGRAQFYLF